MALYDNGLMPELGYEGSYLIPTQQLDPYSMNAMAHVLSSAQNAYAQMYGSDNQARASMYGSNAQRQVGLDENDVQRYLGQLGLQGESVRADQALRGVQAQVEGGKYASDNQLAGTKDTNAANYGLGQLGLMGQLGSSYLGIVPQVQKNQMLNNLLQGQTWQSLLGLGSAGTDGAKAPVPAFQGINPQLLQQMQAKDAAAIGQHYGDQQRGLAQSLGAAGVSANSPGAMMAQQSLGDQRFTQALGSNRDNALGAMNFNAQNQLPYGQAALGQYNQDANRAQQMQLAQMNLGGSLLGKLF